MLTHKCNICRCTVAESDVLRRKVDGKDLFFCHMHVPATKQRRPLSYDLAPEELRREARVALTRMRLSGIVSEEAIKKHCPGLGGQDG